ncbi:glycosyltransferase [Bacillus alkalicellulosilyticus]|uniref:glycosyltransferase n=1 Tax=Alkalihalobacterium alkalicellulosilyticum TaxID=1912214 RepID=UPI001BB08F59|nr:glycosyltransferase [Bacillus alkalicellulosilyticus]
MKKRILISSFDMEIGGVERSLISMLNNFDYKKYQVDLFLYRQQGELLNLIPKEVNLLNEIPQYTTFRKPLKEVLKEGHFGLGASRTLAKILADMKGERKGIKEPGYYQMQLMWKYAIPFLPKFKEEYDIAISYLWPHDFIAKKVKSKKKIAWIHTDYSMVETDVKLDVLMWETFNHIIAVSDACKNSFLKKYPTLANKVEVIENITSPEFIREMAKEVDPDNPMVHDSRFKLLTVARLSHAKGIDNAVKAMKLLKDRGYSDIVWYVVGYGGDENLIRNLIKEYDLEEQFILLGKKTNPYTFIEKADLYVQPSRYEGKAVTVQEAQMLSKPVLITGYNTADSQVVSGENGQICSQSIEGLAEGIITLYHRSELRTCLIDNCKNTDFSNTNELNNLYKIINCGVYNHGG